MGRTESIIAGTFAAILLAVGCVTMTAGPQATDDTGSTEAQTTVAGGKKIDLGKPFDHETHLVLTTTEGDRKVNCEDCHAVEKPGSKFPICDSPRMPFPEHGACTGCHPKAMFTRPLLICTNCHTENTFARQPPLKEQSGLTAPLKTMFSHSLHLDPKQRVKERFKWEKDCSFCHVMTDGGAKVALPAHAQCCECHTDENVQPNINDCAGCHARPAGEVSPRSQIDKFSHKDHTLDPATGAVLDCTRCHDVVPNARKIAEIAKPAMNTCVVCHQGEVAFDYTSCLKCHAPGIEEKPVPESHKKAVEGL